MLRQPVKLGSVVDDLQNQMAMSNAVCIVGKNTTGVAPTSTEGCVLKAPSGIISYEPDELMISLFAGTSMRDINIELQQAKQRIVVPEWGTIGGAIATRRNGLRESHHQTLPNNVLRCTVIAADGSLFQGGGQVVKNVSGFDLVKLLVGSWGLLGLIVEVTMRTEPIPQVSQWVQSPDPIATDQINRLYRPAAVTHINGSTYVLLEGHGQDVHQEISRLNGFTLCEMPDLDHSIQRANLDRLSQSMPHFIERGIRKQFDPTNKLNRHIALQRNLL
jgi:glycolate oxidase FAD binding subunit